jgi:hypothetical protein
VDIYSENDIEEICGFLAFASLLRRFFMPNQTSTTEEERDGYFSIEALPGCDPGYESGIMNM